MDYLTVSILHIPLFIIVTFYTVYGIIALIIGKENRYLSILNNMKDKYYNPFISIVIPTYNEENIIKAKLENTIKIDYPKNRLEVIVIDSSTDKTADIVEEYAKEHSYIKLVKTAREGLASALNKAYSIQIDEPYTTHPSEMHLVVEAMNECIKDIDAKFIMYICYSENVYRALIPYAMDMAVH